MKLCIGRQFLWSPAQQDGNVAGRNISNYTRFCALGWKCRPKRQSKKSPLEAVVFIEIKTVYYDNASD